MPIEIDENTNPEFIAAYLNDTTVQMAVKSGASFEQLVCALVAEKAQLLASLTNAQMRQPYIVIPGERCSEA